MNKKLTRVGMISAVVMVVAIVIIAQTARAIEYIPGAFGTGTTSINSVTCSASIGLVLPAPAVRVGPNDKLVFHYNYSWSDTRASASSVATHTYLIVVNYFGTTSDSRTKYTTGADSGSGYFNVTLSNLQSNTRVWFNYTATISCNSGPQCYDSKTQGSSIWIV